MKIDGPALCCKDIVDYSSTVTVFITCEMCIRDREYATNCKEIDFSNSYNLNDISKVAQLINLKKINLSNTSVREISALKGLKNLTYVNLNNTQVNTEDRFSLFKTDDVSIEAGTEAVSYTHLDVYKRQPLIQD